MIHTTTKVRIFPPSPTPPISPLALVPFLPVREDFHPKRNLARQKLATLSTLRFKDLSSDVYHELVRRYPEFKDEVCIISFSLWGSFLPLLPPSQPSDEFTISPEPTSDDFPSLDLRLRGHFQ